MHIKSIVSAVALSAALGFGGVVYAQDAAATALPTMIGEQQLTEADAQRVKVHCEDLQTAENQAVGVEEDDAENVDADTETDDADADEGEAAVGAIDMDLITITTCLEAGFITAP